ncbi:MAG: hypothetical protein KJ941_07995 [Bacteroidetes bacterium]|nr:hypothetical protein [Bacteroidota bacterium]
MDANLDRYRLRNQDEIIGYERRIGQRKMYSINEYTWSGRVIDGIQRDYCTGWKDLNSKMIYSGDILSYKSKNHTMYCVVHFDEVLNKFQALSIDGDDVLTNFDTKKGFTFPVKRVSYSFIQPL